MSDPFHVLSDASRTKLRKRKQPSWTAPMLATLTEEPFSDPGWIYERKLDGVRCLVFRAGSRVRLLSRNRHPMNATWPELVDRLRRQDCDDFVADGEIVAFRGGRTSFARLQQRIGIRHAAEARESRVAAHLYLFDLLHLQHYDTTRVPLRERKQLLHSALAFGGRLHYTTHRNAAGEAYLADVCPKGWEGLMAKDAAAPYVHRRSRRWLKFKCVRGQELVIGGYTDPQGSRGGFGALLVGYYEQGELRYAGKVGTGYDEETLATLGARLRRIERNSTPFVGAVHERGAHFVRPTLVGEFRFTEWTAAGKLRHPRYVGLRTDKGAGNVHRERPEA